MSLPGLIRFRGKKCDVFRPTKSDGAGGQTQVTWPTQALVRDARILVEPIAEELAQRIFGRNVTVELRGTLLAEPPLQLEDGICLRTGPYAGQRFLVTGKLVHDVRAAAVHQEIALERTTAVFG